MRLTKAEMMAARRWLEAWRTPTEALSRVEAINEAMGATDFFGQAGTTFLRDAWTAASFAAARSAPEVRLVADTWPDAEIRWPTVAGRALIERLEIVEADLPDRRRGDEYRQWEAEVKNDARKKWRSDPIDKMIALAREIPGALTAAVEGKISKRYAGRASLLILLNISEYGIHQDDVIESFAAAAAPALPQFERVWILWKQVAYGPWALSICDGYRT